MSDTAKYMVPFTKWGKWTGNNLAELEAFWADELESRNAELSVEPVSGSLVGTNGFFSGFNIPCPVGEWRFPGCPGGPSDDEALLAQWTEIDQPGFAP
jgi:hypothetical protein